MGFAIGVEFESVMLEKNALRTGRAPANKVMMNILVIAWSLILQDTFLVFRLFGMLLFGSDLSGLKSQHEKVIISILTNLSSFHLYFQHQSLSSTKSTNQFITTTNNSVKIMWNGKK